MLRRIGNKSKIAKVIQSYFPAHKIYIEPFFGAGGMYFNKTIAAYNFLNDIDSEVYNCFDVLIRHKEELRKYIEMIPAHIDFWEESKNRKPDNNIEKAVYFLVLSNFGYMGKPDTLAFRIGNNKDILLQNINSSYTKLVANGNMFTNCDFRELMGKISLQYKDKDKENAFIYSDPPYFETEQYEKKWTKEDVADCMDFTFNSGINAAMSEFNHPFILQCAKERRLTVHTICERRNLKNRKTEILITNYPTVNTLFD